MSQDETADDDAEVLLEGEDFVEGELLDALVLDDAEVNNVELDESALEAIAAAQEFQASYGGELLAEADMGGDENSPSEGVAARADSALDRILRNSSNVNVDAIAALAGENVQAAEEVEDMQGPKGFGKYDEQADSGISQQQRDEIAQFKLTKTELANLVPEVRRGAACMGRQAARHAGGLVRRGGKAHACLAPPPRNHTGLGQHQH